MTEVNRRGKLITVTMDADMAGVVRMLLDHGSITLRHPYLAEVGLLVHHLADAIQDIDADNLNRRQG